MDFNPLEGVLSGPKSISSLVNILNESMEEAVRIDFKSIFQLQTSISDAFEDCAIQYDSKNIWYYHGTLRKSFAIDGIQKAFLLDSSTILIIIVKNSKYHFNILDINQSFEEDDNELIAFDKIFIGKERKVLGLLKKNNLRIYDISN